MNPVGMRGWMAQRYPVPLCPSPAMLTGGWKELQPRLAPGAAGWDAPGLRPPSPVPALP